MGGSTDDADDAAPPGRAMPCAAAEQARRFDRARTARAGVQVEDYVELIAELSAAGGTARTVELARRQGVSHATVIKTAARLRRDGLASGQPYRGLVLTEAGRALAERVRRRHRIVLELLLALGVPRRDAEADAEGIEHHVSAATLEAFDRFLRRGNG